MKGFILAAGFGQRMLPITETLPKPLLPVGNLPLIVYAIKLLAYHKIVDIGINVHHLAPTLRGALGNGDKFGVRLTYSEENEILGTGGGLKRMHKFIDSTTVVVNSDTLVELDLSAKIEEHKARAALATMIVRDDARLEEFGQIDLDRNTGHIRRILGQGSSDADTRKPYMFTGVHILEPRFLEYIPSDIYSCIIRYGYCKALANHEPIFGSVIDTFWADAGTPTRYLAVNQAALTQTVQLRHADPLGGFALTPRCNVAEVVRMGQDTTLGPHTQLRPPVLLGQGARVGDRACVGPGTIVGAHVHIGRDASLQQCIVLEGARIEAGEHLQRMLVGKKGRLALD